MIEGTPLAVHRCRFVDFSPSAITALVFPPLPLPSVKGKKSAAGSSRKALLPGTLAVGRANGNIELYEWTGSERKVQAPQAWVVRKTIPGPYPSKVDCLAFTIKNTDQVGEDEVPILANLRLFSAGGSSELVEWDLERASIRRTVSSQGGSIWAVTPNPAGTQLALGCEDGSIRLVSIEYDALTHLRRFDRIKSRILSIAWGPPVPRETGKNQDKEAAEGSDDDDDDEDDWSDSWLVAGCSDSCLRKWDVGTGRVLDRMTTEKVKGERTLVWTVGVLGDGTIVSGDSMGIVKFWDPVTCTQTDSFPGHAADILCMTISPDGTAVYTSGVDQKVTQFTHVKTTNPNSTSILKRSSARWIMSASRRLHSHDVRALAIWPPHTALPPAYRRQFPIDVAPVLASGGLDMSVNVTPAALAAATVANIINPLATSTEATFEDSYNRRLAYSSGPFNASAVHLARQARLLLCMRDTSLTVWRVLQRRNQLDIENLDLDDEKPDGGFERILDMDLSVHTNLVASAISDDGRWIAVSDWYETKLFELKPESNGDLTPRRIRDFPAILHSQLPDKTPSAGASSLMFSPDSSKLVVATAMSSYVVVFDLGRGGASRSPVVMRKFDQHRITGTIIGGRIIKGKGSIPQHADSHAEAAETQEGEPVETREGGDASESESSLAADDTRQAVAFPTVTRMATSPDGQWLVTTDTHRRTFVYNLDSVTYHATLPTFAVAIHALAFDTASPSTLAIGLADNTLEVYDVETRSFPKWAQKVVRYMPDKFTQMHDPIVGVTFDPGATVSPSGEDADGAGEGAAENRSLPPRNALFWGSSWLCRVKLDATPGSGIFDKRRRRDQNGRRRGELASHNIVNASAPVVEEGEMEKPQRNFTLVTKYRPLLLVDFIGPKELLVVERPLVDVLHSLPPAFFKPKYGRT